jgi:hypothetical protein
MNEGQPLGTVPPTVVARQHAWSSSIDRCMTQGGVCPEVKFLESLADLVVFGCDRGDNDPNHTSGHIHCVTSRFLKNSLQSELFAVVKLFASRIHHLISIDSAARCQSYEANTMRRRRRWT